MSNDLIDQLISIRTAVGSSIIAIKLLERI